MVLTDIIITALADTINIILSFFPSYSGLPSGVANAFNFFIPYWTKASAFFPMGEFITMFKISIGIVIFSVIWMFYARAVIRIK